MYVRLSTALRSSSTSTKLQCLPAFCVEQESGSWRCGAAKTLNDPFLVPGQLFHLCASCSKPHKLLWTLIQDHAVSCWLLDTAHPGLQLRYSLWWTNTDKPLQGAAWTACQAHTPGVVLVPCDQAPLSWPVSLYNTALVVKYPPALTVPWPVPVSWFIRGNSLPDAARVLCRTPSGSLQSESWLFLPGRRLL